VWRSVGRSQVERAVRAVRVVVVDVDAENALELAAVDDQQAVETLPARAADPPLRVGVCVRRLDRRADHGDAFACEDGVEGAAELRVAVVDQDPRAVSAIVEIDQ
jgi:hypothetical protein